MTSVGKGGGGAGGPAKGLAPAHFFPLEGTGQHTLLHFISRFAQVVYYPAYEYMISC